MIKKSKHANTNTSSTQDTSVYLRDLFNFDTDFSNRLIAEETASFVSESELKGLRDLFEQEIANDFVKSSDRGVEIWEYGWSEIVEKIRKSDESELTNVLKPQYYKYSTILYNDTFLKCDNSSTEFKLYIALFFDLAFRYFKDCNTIIDLGCGTCHNLTLLGEQGFNAELVASDWASATGVIAEEISKKKRFDIKFFQLDLKNAEDINNHYLKGNFGVSTCLSLEQIGEDFEQYIELMLKTNPRVVINIEPIFEFYNQSSINEKFASSYHLKRGYLYGYYNRLKQLQNDGKILILDERKTPFGSHFHYPYSVLVWRPL